MSSSSKIHVLFGISETTAFVGVSPYELIFPNSINLHFSGVFISRLYSNSFFNKPFLLGEISGRFEINTSISSSESSCSVSFP